MKKLMYLAIVLFSCSAFAATPPEVNEKVLQAFKTTFTNAEDVTWKELNQACQANFTLNNIVVTAVYDNEGTLLETVRHYSGNNLPGLVLSRLNRHHAGKEILGVTEISAQNEITYDIVLKDKKYWYKVRSDAYGNLDTYERLKDAGPKE